MTETVAEIVDRIGAEHGFEFENSEYFNIHGDLWFEVSIRPSPTSHLQNGHCVGIKTDGRSEQAMATEAAEALASWAYQRLE